MAASQETIEKMIAILREHVDEATLKQVADKLLHVQGNASFRETIRRIAEKLTD